MCKKPLLPKKAVAKVNFQHAKTIKKIGFMAGFDI
jgi:hypothetical protein